MVRWSIEQMPATATASMGLLVRARALKQNWQRGGSRLENS